MTQEQIERNRKGMAALRANEKQAIHKMRDENGGRCCLCVLQDAAIEMGFVPIKRSVALPCETLSEFYGWNHRNPDLKWRGGLLAASGLNDAGISHKNIADAFEETFPEIKVNN